MLIADEDYRSAAIGQFLQIRLHVLGMRDTAKGPEVVDGGSLAVPRLVRHLPVERARRRSVEDVDLEVLRQALRVEHASSHGDDALVAAFHDPILLRRIAGREMPLDAVPPEFHGRELPTTTTTTISAENFELPAGLNLDGGLEVS